MTDLITIEQSKLPYLLSDPDEMEAVIVKIETAALAEVSDTSTKQGRANITSLAYKVSKTKGPLNKVADGLKEDAQATIKAVNAAKKIFDTRMDALRDTLKKPNIKWQDGEDARVAKMEAGIRMEFEFEPDTTSAGIVTQIDELKAVSVEKDVWSEFSGAAQVAKKQMLETLRDKLELVRVREDADAKAEANRKELEELRAKQAQADKERAEADAKAEEARQVEYRRVEAEREAKAKSEQEARDKELADMRAEQAKKDAEAAEQKAEDDREAEALRAENARLHEAERKRDAELAESKRQKDLKDAEAASEKAEAEVEALSERKFDEARGLAIKAFYDADMTESDAEMVVDLIIDGKIPNIEFEPKS